MRTIEEVEAFLNRSINGEVRNRLVDRGVARAMMRRNGIMPEDSRPFARAIDTDLAELGFAVLDAALELKALDGNPALARQGFYMAGRVFEALVKNGQNDRPERGFHKIIAAASYHLASYSAVAFALFSGLNLNDQNLNRLEVALVRLVLRDMAGVRRVVREWLQTPDYRDNGLRDRLRDEGSDQPIVLVDAIITGGMRSLAYYEFALQTGRTDLAERAFELIDATYGLAGETGHASLWWIVRLIRDLLGDLWDQSLHRVLPNAPNGDDGESFGRMREIFIASLYQRAVAQVELWPSQIDAARRATDPDDDLVVALPTSAGKTRIAELAALTALSLNKRVLIVTPLRALSAQTERIFRESFSPLGITVSSLYGASGLSPGDAHTLTSDAIVVATPEKLDFALRSDPFVIDDVGLIVLDEGHMIGPTDREVRYEILVQRLLKRADAEERRIVCLSAILNEDQSLSDMTNWIRADEEGEPIRSDWRPTEQRFGTLEWYGDQATLRYDLDEEGPFVSRFITSMRPRGQEVLPHPRDIKGVTVMAAWRFAAEGKTTLIFITQANWVEGFAREALNLVRRGYLPPLLDDEALVANAVAVGEEWLGADHPAVMGLKIGIAVHHGKLPNPFLREVERILSAGVIKVIVASPTLAQGLNLNAAVLLAPYLTRSGVVIKADEFANVAGRAGRAFVDTEGLIVHVVWDNHEYRKGIWKNLVNSARARELTSGLILVVSEVVKRLRRRGIALTEDGLEFLANSRADWLVEPENIEDSEEPIEDLIARLDSIVLGLVEALDADSDELPRLLDEALEGSFWARQVERKRERFREIQTLVMKTRARVIWASTSPDQRRGHFAMGLGLESGLAIDDIVEELAVLIDAADLGALQGDLDAMYANLADLGERLLRIKPFCPDSDLDVGWSDRLSAWLSGAPIADIGEASVPLIEDAFIYRLVWALEAVRTRRVVLGWEPEDGTVAGAAAACIETGVPSYRMSMLVRAGLPSRSAAVKAVEDTDPDFIELNGMRDWVKSDAIINISANPDWPSAETHEVWERFRNEFGGARRAPWETRERRFNGSERFHNLLDDGVFRIEPRGDGNWYLRTADYDPLGSLTPRRPLPTSGIVYGEWDGQEGRIRIIAPD